MSYAEIRDAIRVNKITKEVRTAILVEARNLIAKENAWCKKHAAIDEQHHDIDPYSPRACRWCIMGALHHVCFTCQYDQVPFDVTYLLRQQIGGEIAEFNDAPGTRHADVLAMLDGAIERSKK